MTLDLGIIIQGAFGIILALGVKGVFSLRNKVSEMNGSVRELKTWADGHEKLDDERQRRTDVQFDTAFRYINELKE